MHLSMRLSLNLLVLAGAAAAQQSVWGQCGGQGWTGPTTCVSGSVCQKANDWYSQCVPGNGPSPTLTTTTTTTSTQRPSPPGSTAVAVPGANGTLFTIDGVTSYFPGTNCYWCSVGNLPPADVDLVLDHVAASGLKILRVWGFSDVNTIPSGNQVWFQHLPSSSGEPTINTGPNGLQKLDYTVAAAERRGLKLIVNFVNNWDDYGGVKAYTNAFGGSHQGWYTNARAQAQYRRYVRAVVERYEGSEGIFAWELANEPRCQGCETGVIYEWARETARFVKGVDRRKRMVTLGDEGMGMDGAAAGDGSYPYSFYEGTDFVRNLGIEELDFGTFHLYPDHWGTSYDWGNRWIKDHAAACVAANKPCFFEEYGTTTRHCELERPWQVTSVNTPGMGADAFWQLGDTISTGRTHDDGFTIYYGSSDWKCLVTDHVQSIG